MIVIVVVMVVVEDCCFGKFVSSTAFFGVL